MPHVRVCPSAFVFLLFFFCKLLLHCSVRINSKSPLILISYSNELVLKCYKMICNSMSNLSPTLGISSFPKTLLLKTGETFDLSRFKLVYFCVCFE